MQGEHVALGPVHLHGTLAADAVGTLSAPFDCTLEQLSAVASNASSATLKVGTAADDDGYITAFAIGQSGVPVVKDAGDFNGALVTAANGPLPRIKKGDVVKYTLDFDGAAGTAAQNVVLLFTLLEG